MACPTKRCRPIMVDGQTYLWRVRHKTKRNPYIKPAQLTFTVRRADCRGGTLVVQPTGATRPTLSYCCAATGAVLLPSLVAEAVRGALAAGWRPTDSGKPFHFPVAPSFELRPTPVGEVRLRA